MKRPPQVLQEPCLSAERPTICGGVPGGTPPSPFGTNSYFLTAHSTADASELLTTRKEESLAKSGVRTKSRMSDRSLRDPRLEEVVFKEQLTLPWEASETDRELLFSVWEDDPWQRPTLLGSLSVLLGDERCYELSDWLLKDTEENGILGIALLQVSVS